MRVVILEDAAEDLELGAQFYEFLREGRWGLLFRFDPFRSRFSGSLRWDHPIYFQFHRMLSRRFPFAIYYEVEAEVRYVYAILDLRRDPVWIREQLRKRR